MRCIICQNFSFIIICKTCQKNLLKPSFNKRELTNNFFVYSFYHYDDVQDLLHTKYKFYGDRVFKILATLSFHKFGENFEYPNKVYAIPIDDHTRHDFSQTAILSKSLKSKNIIPIYNSLKASNIIKYAGKDLEYRKTHKREFKYSGKKDIKVILIDDVVTTGLTILEAKSLLETNNCEVLFALTITNAKI